MKVLAGYAREGDGALRVLFQGEGASREVWDSLAWQELCPESFWDRC